MNNNLIVTVAKFIFSLFTKSPEVEVTIPIDPTPEDAKPAAKPGIDWTDPSCHVTSHFTVKDCLMLHSWNRLATEEDGADFEKLIALCDKMEQVRNVLECEINVHCMFRSQAYNESQKIKPVGDVHSMSLACDFDSNGYLTIEQVKAKLLPVLSTYGIRMEKGTTTWVHIDLHGVGPSGRYFSV